MAAYTKEIKIYIALDLVNIVLSLFALVYIPISYLEIIRSINIFFVVLFESILMKTRYKMITLLTLIPIITGMTLATVNELSFDERGFIAAVVSAVVAGLQTVAGAHVMKKKIDVFNMLRLLSIPCSVILVFLILILEFVDLFKWIESDKCNPLNIFLVLLSGALAFLYNSSIFWVFKLLISATISVWGNLKIVINILVSVMIYKNPINAQGGLGIAINVLGCFAYSLIKHKSLPKKPRAKGSAGEKPALPSQAQEQSNAEQLSKEQQTKLWLNLRQYLNFSYCSEQLFIHRYKIITGVGVILLIFFLCYTMK